MPHETPAAIVLTAVLAAVAGFVDAIGFLDTGGLFVSFMSGNSTQAAVDVLGPEASIALASAGIVASFVAGVTLGSMVGGRVGNPQAWIVGGAAAAVGASAVLAIAGEATLWRAGVLAAAMGALNTLYHADGRARVAITYSTGTLVSLGLALGALAGGGSSTAWRRPLLLWSSLVAGAVIGAVVHRVGSPLALAVAAAVLAAVTSVFAAAGRRGRGRARGESPSM